MSMYIIEGGKRLTGETFASGSKNAALPILAATILNKGTTKLYNIPDIKDTNVTLQILTRLGCKVKKSKDKIIIDSSKMNENEVPEELMREMRSSVIIAGAILGRFKNVRFSYPGDCDIWWIHLTSLR